MFILAPTFRQKIAPHERKFSCHISNSLRVNIWCKIKPKVALDVGTILPKRGYAACEHHHGARTCTRTAAFTVSKCFRHVDKKISDEKNKL